MSQSFFDLIRRGKSAEVAAWIEENPEIAQSRDAQGVSALLWSIYSGHTVIRDFLLARLNALDVFEAAAAGECARLAALLAANPEVVSSTSPDGWTPLHLAAAFGTSETVALLLRHGADVHARSTNPMRNQPLHAALALGRDSATIQRLLAHGADVNAVQHGGFRPVHQAAAAGRADLIELLLAAGAEKNALCDKGKTAAEYARARGHAEAAALLA